MGAWAEDAFGNDTACDWAGDFARSPSLESVVETLNEVINGEYIESDEGTEALVACEVVARLKGNWGVKNAYSEEVDKWVSSVNIEVITDLVELAIKAIKAILSDESELKELWNEDGVNEKWKLAMDDLLERVSG